MEQDQFFMVWNPQQGAPRVQHRSLDLARAEAERLARGNPGQRFIVLASVGECVKDDVRWESHGDEIPF